MFSHLKSSIANFKINAAMPSQFQFLMNLTHPEIKKVLRQCVDKFRVEDNDSTNYVLAHWPKGKLLTLYLASFNSFQIYLANYSRLPGPSRGEWKLKSLFGSQSEHTNIYHVNIDLSQQSYPHLIITTGGFDEKMVQEFLVGTLPQKNEIAGVQDFRGSVCLMNANFPRLEIYREKAPQVEDASWNHLVATAKKIKSLTHASLVAIADESMHVYEDQTTLNLSVTDALLIAERSHDWEILLFKLLEVSIQELSAENKNLLAKKSFELADELLNILRLTDDDRLKNSLFLHVLQKPNALRSVLNGEINQNQSCFCFIKPSLKVNAIIKIEAAYFDFKQQSRLFQGPSSSN